MNPRHLVDTTVFFSPTSGGVRRYLTTKHSWLSAQSGWQHTLLVPGTHHRLERGGISTLAGMPIPYTFNYRLPLNPHLWTRRLAALAPDIIETADAFHPAWAAWRVACERHIPCVAFCHSNLPRIVGQRLGRGVERLANRYLRELYRRFDVVFAPSRMMLEFLDSVGVSHALYQPLGVDTLVFHPCRRGAWLRECLGLRSEARVLVYAGRCSDEKNLPVLLRAFGRLGRPYHLVIIGGARSATLASNVTLVAYRRNGIDLARWLASADALVHAGTCETFGLVILEAMACGRPVVATRAAAVPELINERCGLLCAPGDAISLADAVAALYEQDLEALGANARAHVLRYFTWPQVFERQLSVYRALLAGANPVILQQQSAPAG
jgi:alpha-1,6-mannosyltransferase